MDVRLSALRIGGVDNERRREDVGELGTVPVTGCEGGDETNDDSGASDAVSHERHACTNTHAHKQSVARAMECHMSDMHKHTRTQTVSGTSDEVSHERHAQTHTHTNMPAQCTMH